MEQQHLLFLLRNLWISGRRFSSISKIKIIRLIFGTRVLRRNSNLSNRSTTIRTRNETTSSPFPSSLLLHVCGIRDAIGEQRRRNRVILKDANEPFSEESHPRGYLSSFSIIFAKVTPWVWTRYESIEGIFTRFSRADSKQERSRSCKINRCT